MTELLLESPDILYRNRGDGTFENVTEEALPHLAYFGMGSDFADIARCNRDCDTMSPIPKISQSRR